MPIRPIKPGEKVGMKFTADQRTLLCAAINPLPEKFRTAIEGTSANEPLSLTLGDWEELGDAIAAAAYQVTDERLEEKLDDLCVRIDLLLEAHVDVSDVDAAAEPGDGQADLGQPLHEHTFEITATDVSLREQASTNQTGEAGHANSKLVAMLLDWADNWATACREAGTFDEPRFELHVPSELIALLEPPLLSDFALAARLKAGPDRYSGAEIAEVVKAFANAMAGRPVSEQLSLAAVVMQLMDQIETAVAGPAKKRRTVKPTSASKEGTSKKGAAQKTASKKGALKDEQSPAGSDDVPAKSAMSPAAARAAAKKMAYQITITLKNIEPMVWRRILVKDCTLDQLHWYIQQAMGWKNQQMHQFQIGKTYYADPSMVDPGWASKPPSDSLHMRLSDLVAEGLAPDELIAGRGKPFVFNYEYDFASSWHHEIVIERLLDLDSELRYPLCVIGARACPPEDIGGPWGYTEYLAALADPAHPRHAEFLKRGGPYDPTQFNAVRATTAMRRRA